MPGTHVKGLKEVSENADSETERKHRPDMEFWQGSSEVIIEADEWIKSVGRLCEEAIDLLLFWWIEKSMPGDDDQHYR